ncbi:MAG: hypothetical protein VW378_06420 [bacterium]
MKHKEYRLFRYLKQPDLHAITALKTMQGLLGLSWVKSLKRYDFWTFSLVSSQCKEDDFWSLLLSGSFEFINPNKHAYDIGRLHKRRLDNRRSMFLLKSSALSPCLTLSRRSFLTDKLTDVGISYSLLWEIVCERPVEDAEACVSEMQTRLIDGQNGCSGLLVNSLFEKAEWCSQEDYYE